MRTNGSHTRVTVAGAVLLLLSGLAAGCLERRDEPEASDNSCTSCHGSDERESSRVSQAAPPADIDGNTSSRERGVGAHQHHLTASDTHAPVACDECHVVPEETFSEGHVDSDPPAEITFGELARTGGRSPSYSARGQSCSDTYCHRDSDPNWTGPRNSEDACGSCHGLPPPLPHAQSERCFECHADVVDEEMAFIAPELHVNGTVEAAGGCNTCHGSDDSPAPPRDLLGNTEATSPGVGAHQAHLVDRGITRPLACEECHVVPARSDDAGHLDDSPGAEVVFSGVATAGNTTPSYDYDAGTCSGSWCHGPSAPADSVSPEWTAALGGLGCTDCHGLPPPAPHPQNHDCEACHGEVIEAGLQFVAPDRHVNGAVDVVLACNSCHGSADSNAPPPDLLGGTDTTSPGVGAHQAHLTGANGSRAVGCDECHTVPTAVDDPGHLDSNDGAELVFSGVAATSGAEGEYDAAAGTCSGTWCHGPTDPAGSVSPEWTTAGPLDCSSCHGFPPPAPHPAATDCWQCHDGVDSELTFTDPSLHVDGNVDLLDDCNTCHGSDTSNAPPVDLLGNTDSSSRGVGAHQTHLGATNARALACDECHTVPADRDDPGHLDDTAGAELDFFGVATTGGNSVSYDATTLTCSGTWCHGPSDPGGSTSPEWTSSDPLGCSDCHGFPPPTPHPDYAECWVCHGNVDDTLAFVDPTLHINGSVELNSACNACHGSDDSNAPPIDLLGNTDPASPGVGAHQAHLAGSGLGRTLACDECHVVPTAVDDAGHLDSTVGAELDFSGVAATGGNAVGYDDTALTCSGTWCHGPSDPAASVSPEWTSAGPLGCTDCHGLPPAAPHVNVTICYACHTNVTDSFQFVDPDLHINGEVDF